jgi:putative PIN family toxin of toxin-antitoxin system
VRIVLDTAALITALRSSKGAAAETIRLILHRRLTILMDCKLACEYRDVAMRSDHLAESGLSVAEVERFIRVLEALAEPVEIFERHRPLSNDQDDDMVLDVAINGHADAIVTNNVRHLRDPAKHFGVQVLTPRDLLLAMQKGR